MRFFGKIEYQNIFIELCYILAGANTCQLVMWKLQKFELAIIEKKERMVFLNKKRHALPSIELNLLAGK